MTLQKWRKCEDGSGHSVVVEECVWAAILLFRVRGSDVLSALAVSEELLIVDTEMKLVTAAIYSNFRTTVVDDDGIEAIDAYTVKPTSDKLILKFEHI